MKVTLLLAQCTSELLKKSVQIIAHVLRELDVELSQVELHKLPYFQGEKTRQMDSIMASISESKGVIAISSVPMLGMHGAMQSFFDNMTWKTLISLCLRLHIVNGLGSKKLHK